MFRKFLKVIGFGVLLLLLVTAISFLVLYLNKDSIIRKIKSEIGSQVGGEVLIGDVSLNIIRYFPQTSIRLSNVSIRDSLYYKHKHELVHLEELYAQINIRNLLSSKIEINQVLLENGTINLFTDSSGYSNNYLFKHNTDTSANGFRTTFKDFVLKNINFVYSDSVKHKAAQILLEDVKLKIINQKEIIEFPADAKIKIAYVSFNTSKGKFFRGTELSGNLPILYNKTSNAVLLDTCLLELNHDLVTFSVNYCLGDSAMFHVGVKSGSMVFQHMLPLLKEQTEARLKQFEVGQAVSFNVTIDGLTAYGNIPVVKANIRFPGNNLTIKNHHFYNCRFNCLYSNERGNRKDEDSFIRITNFISSWESVPITSDSIIINNLKSPQVSCTIKSTFALPKLNSIYGSDLFYFSKGTGNLDLHLETVGDTIKQLNGIIVAKNGKVIYNPRSVPFDDLNMSLRFSSRDVFVDKLNCRVKNSKLTLSGEGQNVIALIDGKKGPVQFVWNLNSPAIDLADFTNFLGARKGVKKVTSKAPYSSAETTLDQVIDAANVRISVNVAEIKYGKFRALNLIGAITMINNNWNLEHISFHHADGDVRMHGTMDLMQDENHAVKIQADLEKVDISKLFTAFNNFSQRAVTDKNLKGSVNASVDIGFIMSPQSVIRQSSLKGSVDLTILDGELNGFQPLGDLSKYIFKNRDFSNIRFSELSNTFTVTGPEINFERMKINSSVLEMYVEGTYFLDGKTDMNIQIPVSNLKKRDWDEISDNISDKGKKGMNIFIHAVTDDKGKLHFRYDPLRKWKDKREEKIKKIENWIRK